MHELRRTTACLWLAALACTTPQKAAPPPSPELVRYYQSGLPEAERFVAKAISPQLLAPADANNQLYFEAYGQNGALAGYVRDFEGPVTTAEGCPCNPLKLTLVFNADHSLRTIISPAPLQKYGHESLTPAETQRLIELARAAPAKLLAVPQVERVVDATTGATRRELADVVVPQAGLSTRRIAGLVRDTRDILGGATVDRDRVRLHALLAPHPSPLTQAQRLAAALPAFNSDAAREQAFSALCSTYGAAVHAVPDGDAAVEATLVAKKGAPAGAGEPLAHLCYNLAEKRLRPAFVARCLARLSDPDCGVAPELVALVTGTARWAEGDKAGSVAPLQRATRRIPLAAAPDLYVRLGDALQATGERQAACSIGRQLFDLHPLMPQARHLLHACADATHPVEAIVKELNDAAQQRLLASRRKASAAPALALQDSNGKNVSLQLGSPGQVTVAVAFATWCPHCRAELPRLTAFVDQLRTKTALRDRVRVVGLRTAIERENIPWERFVADFHINFPVYTDAHASSTFSALARHEGIAASLPTTAVVDPAGVVRYLLPAGDFRDTGQELTWACESLLPTQSASAQGTRAESAVR